MKTSVAIVDSERVWRKLEPLLDLYDRTKTKTLAKDIVQLSRAYGAALDKERKLA